jgi:acyl transferase domain-containing protein
VHEDLLLVGTNTATHTRRYGVPTAAEGEARCRPGSGGDGDGDIVLEMQGRMAAVGLDVETLQTAISQLGLRQTCVACFNSPKGQTVSGAASEVALLKQHLTASQPDLFWRDVNTDGVAYHAPHLEAHYDALVAEFESALGLGQQQQQVARPLDPRWLVTGGQAADGSPATVLDGHFQALNITGPVRFTQALAALPPNTLVALVVMSTLPLDSLAPPSRLRRVVRHF